MKGLNTKELIIRKAADLFNTHGYYGCSLSDIMKATKLQKGGIYNHFKNKDEIACAAFDHSFGLILKRFRKQLDVVKSPTDKLESIISVFISFHNDPIAAGGCPILNTAAEVTESLPELQKKAKDAVDMLRNYIQIKIKEGQSAGEFYELIDSDKFASLMVSTLEGALLFSRLSQDETHIHIAAEHLRQHIKNTLLL